MAGDIVGHWLTPSDVNTKMKIFRSRRILLPNVKSDTDRCKQIDINILTFSIAVYFSKHNFTLVLKLKFSHLYNQQLTKLCSSFTVVTLQSC